MALHPILLKPTGKDYLWGGERLKNEYDKEKYEELNELHPLAETWECSAHPDGPSYAVYGEYKGKSLAEIIKSHPEFLGDKRQGDEFPILIKFIDAQKDLSVQVHPSDEYAWEHENHQRGKTEMWYVLEAQPGAQLVWGFEHEVTAELLKKHIKEGTLNADLHYVPVHKGDVFLIKSGTVHAIGAGIVISEIQENSNLTYRLYDYNRPDPHTGKLRELHFDKAVQVLNMLPIGNTNQQKRLVHYYYGCSRETLCRCEYFETERIQVTKGFSFSVKEQSFQVLLCINGEGGLELDGSNRPLRFAKGACIFLPANLGRCHVIGKCELLKVRC
jgi:mannose-6-phosphate isomerase